jgi:muramoyltetrapeptide carboxypeptidase LdcA involved in peptidoglycan recycling
MIPKKLKAGDEVRVLTTARSLAILSKENRMSAVETLQELGLNVSFGAHAEEADEFASNSIERRVEDIHAAFSDPHVKMVLPVIGGFNANQMLNHLDYKLIKKNPKIFGGFSDNTVLQNAIFTKTGLVTYSSPNFSSFAHPLSMDYTVEYFIKCLFQDKPYVIAPSKKWDDYSWWKGDRPNETQNSGFWVINGGKAEGTILGANLNTFGLLQGTEFMPDLRNSVLFFEDDDMSNAATFDRDLQSVIHQPSFKKVRGIVIGRFEIKSQITRNTITRIIKTKRELDRIPVVANVDFGHTNPLITFPIGGSVALDATKEIPNIIITKH